MRVFVSIGCMVAVLMMAVPTLAFSLSMKDSLSSRRAFFTKSLSTATAAAAAVAGSSAPPSVAATPEVFETPSGIKYAITKPAKEKVSPVDKDLAAIEYTGYLTDGRIFDATHAEGKKNALLFEVGGNAVIPGVNEMVKTMSAGEKVQAIIPPELAFGEKGICLEGGECLVKPGATLVYDIYLKRFSLAPP